MGALTIEAYVTKRRKSTKIITNLLVEDLLRPVCTQPSETDWPHYRPGRDHPTGAELDCNLVLPEQTHCTARGQGPRAKEHPWSLQPHLPENVRSRRGTALNPRGRVGEPAG